MASLRQEQSAFAKDFAQFLVWLTAHGYEYTFGEGERTAYQQAQYVRTGRSKTLRSNHIIRLAHDLHIFKDGKLLSKKEDLAPLGTQWELMSSYNRWGGNFKSLYDAPHFERNVPGK